GNGTAPDKNHANSRPSNACPSGTEGVHPQPAAPDRMHSENATDASGTVPFTVKPDIGGPTQLVAWADIQGFDLFCVGDPSSSASIGWSVKAPAPRGLPYERCSAARPPVTCPKPNPGPNPSPSPSGSPTATPTAT